MSAPSSWLHPRPVHQTISTTDRVLATPIRGSALAWLGFHAAGLALCVGPLRDRTLNKLVPNAEIITTDTGHLIPIDDPDTVTTAILRALRSDYRNSLSASPANGYVA
jgi:hypothetical protein